MKKAIVFGCNGYLGRHLTYFLKLNNIEVLPLGKSSKSVDKHVNYQQVDISKKKDILSLDFNVDYIFVFAGLTGTTVGFDEYKQFIMVNEIGLLNILDHHKNTKSKARIVFPSTRLVYKGEKDEFLKEAAKKEAKTIYAQNKLACEQYLKMYQNYYGINYTIFRIGVPYGNLMDDNYSYGTLGFFLKKVENKENIILYGDGKQKRTFTHVEDIIQVIIKSLPLERTKNNIYNIGSNDNLSLLEIANLIASKYDINVELADWPLNVLKVESGDTIFAGEKLQKELNYKYKHSIKGWVNEI